MISIIIPTLNEERIIERTLKSLREYKGNFEIIVSDGKSKDKTLEIAKKYADKIVVYEGKIRQTIAMGRNMGAAAASGELLLFLDADTFMPDINNFLPKVIKKFDENPKLVGLVAFLKVFPEMETFGDRFIFGMVNYFTYIENNILHKGDANGGEFQVVRTDAFEKAKGYDEKMVVAEANDFFRRLSDLGETRMFRDLTVYHTGRRAHKIGWLKLYWLWSINFLSVLFRKKSVTSEWEEVR